MPQKVQASVSSVLPLDSRIYPALDKLAGLGLIDSSLRGDRPYTRLEAARQIREASRNVSETSPFVALQIIQRLELELALELRELDDHAEGSGTYFSPLRRLEVAYIHKDGQQSRISTPSVGASVDASQFALNANNYGLDYAEGSNVEATFETELRLGRFLLFNWRPLWTRQDDETSSMTTLGSSVALGLGAFELSAGRQSLWWGQGRHGSLLLTNNAKPLDMARITNPSPILLPWIFKYLGPFRFDVFWSKLEEERFVPEPYFAGLRLGLKPIPWFEIGLARTVMFGGEGRPDVGTSDFVTILGGKNLEGGEDTSNSLAVLDARLKFPFLANLELYGELGGEDEASGFISNKAYLVGGYLPRLEPTGRASLRVEYADLSHVDANSPLWYRHGIYRSGYTYEGKIMGHHVGGGGKDLYLALELWLPGDVDVTLGYDLEKRGVDTNVREEHREPFAELAWKCSRSWTIEARYAVDTVENPDFVPGTQRRDSFGSFRISGAW